MFVFPIYDKAGYEDHLNYESGVEYKQIGEVSQEEEKYFRVQNYLIHNSWEIPKNWIKSSLSVCLGNDTGTVWGGKTLIFRYSV